MRQEAGSIGALCERDPKAAKPADRRFSECLRGNMNSRTVENLIPFEAEMQHTRLCLDLLRYPYARLQRAGIGNGEHMEQYSRAERTKKSL